MSSINWNKRKKLIKTLENLGKKFLSKSELRRTMGFSRDYTSPIFWDYRFSDTILHIIGLIMITRGESKISKIIADIILVISHTLSLITSIKHFGVIFIRYSHFLSWAPFSFLLYSCMLLSFMMLEAYLVYSHIRSSLKKLSIVDTKAQDVKTTMTMEYSSFVVKFLFWLHNLVLSL